MKFSVDARGVTNAFGYDVAGRRTVVTNAFGSIGTTNGFIFDLNGNQIATIDALGHATTNIFDPLNRVVQMVYADGTKTSTGYDAAGRRVAETNQDSIVTLYGYDGAGRLISVTNALGTAQQIVTQYQYDESGNETAQIDALNRITTFAYDSMGRRIKHVLPQGQSETMGYDLAGNLIRSTNFNGVVLTNLYDLMNRLTNRASIGGYSISFGYDRAGNRTNMTDTSGTTAYNYDVRSRLATKVLRWIGGPTNALNYAYDCNGNVTNIWSSSTGGVNLQYAYDALSRITNVLAEGATAATYAYDPNGNLQSVHLGNSVTNLYQYDALNRLTNSVWQSNQLTLASFYYKLGTTGNRTNLTETLLTAVTNRTYAWGYDSLYRLTNENISGLGTLGYQFDPLGNRTNRYGSGSVTNSLPAVTNAYSANDWLTNDAYDSNGNTLWDTNVTAVGPYFYDVENRLTNYNNVVYLGHNGDGLRVSKTVNGTNVFYLVDDRNPSGYAQVLEEWTAAGGSTNLTRVYNYGLSLLSQKQGSAIYYFIADGHASTRLLTDNAGAVANTFTYDAYGSLIASNTTAQTVFLYCGEQSDPDLRFYYLRARYYTPWTGRFWTMDTEEGDNEDPTSLHKYLYCYDDAINHTDPTGLKLSPDDDCKPDYDKAIQYLREKSAKAVEFLNGLDAPAETYNYPIKLTKEDSHFNNDTKEVRWNSHMAIAIKQSEADAVSPALILIHELKHAYDLFHKVDEGKNETVVMDFERAVAKELGECLRPNHYDGYTFLVTDPTKRGPVPPPPDPLKEYLKGLTNRNLKMPKRAPALSFGVPGYYIDSDSGL